MATPSARLTSLPASSVSPRKTQLLAASLYGIALVISNFATEPFTEYLRSLFSTLIEVTFKFIFFPRVPLMNPRGRNAPATGGFHNLGQSPAA